MSLHYESAFNKALPPIIVTLVAALIGGIGWVLKNNWKSVCSSFIKLWLFYFPQPFNIVFSIESKSELPSGSYNNELKKKFSENLDHLGLTKIAKVKDFEDLKYFKNKEEAEAYLQNHELDLIIWGRVTEDRLKSEGKNKHEFLLNLSSKTPKDPQNLIQQVIMGDIQAAFVSKRHFSIIEESSFRDLKIATDDLTDISLYILGTTLLLRGNLSETLKVFEMLYERNKNEPGPFLEKVKFRLNNIYELLGIKNAIDEKRYKPALEYYEKILRIFPKNHNALVGQAYCCVQLGFSEKGEQAVSTLEKLFPNSAHTLIDLAYFRIVQKKYNEALKFYERIKSIEV